MHKLLSLLFHRPIKGQLTMLVMLVTLTTLVLLVLSFMYNDVNNLRKSLSNELDLVSGIIGKRVITRLAFSQADKAAQDLADLEQKDSVYMACVYDRDGKLFADYLAGDDSSKRHCPNTPPTIGQFKTWQEVSTTRLLKSNTDEFLGTFYVVSDLQDVYERLEGYAITTLIVVIVVVLIAAFITRWLQDIITRPIYDLVDATHAIRSGDYTARVEVEAHGEIRDLTNSFNTMMKVLEDYKMNLETMVEEKTVDLQRALQEAEKAREQAERANALQNEWIRNIGHEVRTPLHGIVSFTNFGMEDAADETTERKKLTEYFEKIQKSTKRLRHLVDELLDFGKLDAGKMNFMFSSHDLLKTIQEVASEMSGRFQEKQINFSIDSLADDTIGHYDNNRIGQVMTNLIGNAIKFVPEHGVIEVRLDRDNAKDVFHIMIEDNGPGIPEKEVSEIFDTFRQSSYTSDGSGGTGLGLSICKKIVEAHAGEIWAENAQESGAIFHVIIPVKVHEPSEAV